MAPPNRPWVLQVNWTDADTSPPWSNSVVNDYTSRWVDVQVERYTFRGSLKSDTMSATIHDPGYNIRPPKQSSALWPNVVLGRRGRFLAQTALGSGVWHPWFFGYARDYQPKTTRDPSSTTTVLFDGPLAQLANMDVKLSPSLGAVVWDADDPYHTGLWHLLNEAGLWGSNVLDLENVGAVTLPDDWAGDGGDDIADPDNWITKKFGEWLAYLAQKANCFVADEPQYASADGDPDFKLHWYQVVPGQEPDYHMNSRDRHLEGNPSLSYNGELVF